MHLEAEILWESRNLCEESAWTFRAGGRVVASSIKKRKRTITGNS